MSDSPGLVSLMVYFSPSMTIVSFALIPRVNIASDGMRMISDSFSIALSTVYGPLTVMELSLGVSSA